jgi:hypothetical protein
MSESGQEGEMCGVTLQVVTGEATLKRKRMTVSTRLSNSKYSDGLIYCSALANIAFGVSLSKTLRRSLNCMVKGVP